MSASTITTVMPAAHASSTTGTRAVDEAGITMSTSGFCSMRLRIWDACSVALFSPGALTTL